MTTDENTVGARRRWLIPLGALVSLVGAALLAERVRPLGSSDGPRERRSSKVKVSQVVFPRDRPALRPAPKPALAEAPSDAEPGPSRPLDRFERAAALPGRPVVIAELNAIRHSELAEAILRCQRDDVERAFQRIREETGLDPLNDLDRMMFADGSMVMSGYFDELRIPEGRQRRPYGDDAQMFPPADDGTVIVRHGKDLLMVFDDLTAAEAAVDRIEGRAPSELPAPLLEGGADIYGPISQELLRPLLQSGPLAPLLGRIEEASVRVSVDDHVAMSVDFDSGGAGSPAELQDLVRAGLSALRVEAAREGRQDVVELLRATRIGLDEDGQLAVDLAVPGDVVLQWMDCPAEPPAP